MEIAILVILIASHGLAMKRFWSALSAGAFPKSVDFAIASFIVYYDAGILLEVVGIKYSDPYFQSVFVAEEWVQALTVFYIMIGPWVLLAGSAVLSPRDWVQQDSLHRLAPFQYKGFVILAIGVGLCLALLSLSTVIQSGGVVYSRSEIATLLGPLIIVLYIPIHFVAFFVRQENSRSKLGTLTLVFLVILAMAGTLAIGQRTTILLPLLIVAMFRIRLSPIRLVTYATVGTLAAAMLLTTFKYYYSDSTVSIQERVVDTVNTDFARAGALSYLVDTAPSFGTDVMPYEGAGYVYSTLYFVPRELVQSKGHSTSQLFTMDLIDSEDFPKWSIALGAMEEVIVNFGYFVVIPALFVYGLGFGALDRLVRRVPSVIVPASLAGVWLCGYHLPAIMLLFGSMTLTLVVLHLLVSYSTNWGLTWSR